MKWPTRKGLRGVAVVLAAVAAALAATGNLPAVVAEALGVLAAGV